MRILFIAVLFIGFLKIAPANADAGLSVAVGVVAIGFIVAAPFLDKDEEEIDDDDGFFSDDLGRSRIEFIKIDQELDRGI
jgi:hypothetical protein